MRNHWKALVAGLLATVFVFSTNATSVAWAQRDSDLILAELRQIQSQLAELHRAQESLEAAFSTLQDTTEDRQGSVRKTMADTTLTLGDLRDQFSVLSSRVDEANQRLSTMQQEMSSMRYAQQPLVVPPSSDESEDGVIEVPVAGGSGAHYAGPTMAQGPLTSNIYKEAYTDFQQGRYPLAISGFKEVMSTAPRGDLADNAQYWIGECYLAQRQYDHALEAFDRVIRNHPDSNKLADAYFKKAVVLESLDKRSEAMLMYELIIEQFANAPVARLAKQKLERLMRSTTRSE